MRNRLEQALTGLWYGSSHLPLVLLPLSACYCGFVRLRRQILRGRTTADKSPTRTIVVGNLVVGGGGKTPAVIALAEYLSGSGYRVGLLCRGYQGRATAWPQWVDATSDPQLVGDEAVLLARRTGLPVAAGPDRVEARATLLAREPCDLLISDDGLQHYALQRDLELLVVDQRRGFGNGYCLPAGPLREPLSRIKSVDAVLGADAAEARRHFALNRRLAGHADSLASPGRSVELTEFRHGPVHAVAGIANAEGFFEDLRAVGLEVIPHDFPDHHPYSRTDLDFGDPAPVLMTEKDAVKCARFAQKHWWSVPLDLELGSGFEHWLSGTLEQPE